MSQAVSVSLPTWKSNIGYEEGEDWVVSKMTTGYPRLIITTHPLSVRSFMSLLENRFFVHRSIRAFSEEIIAKFGKPGQQAMLFPSPCVAERCLDFMRQRVRPGLASQFYTLDLAMDAFRVVSPMLQQLCPKISAVVFPEEGFPIAKQYWQHTGDGISSRRAEFCHDLFKDNLLVPRGTPTELCTEANPRLFKGPKRYQRTASIDGIASVAPKKSASSTPSPTIGVVNESQESSRFLEERYGRNLELSLVERAKSAIRRRIAGAMAGDFDLADDRLPDMSINSRGLYNLREDDVYLFPAGMNAIFNAHRTLLATKPAAKSINFGFPYVDTLKILQKFGPGCQFYGHGSDQDLDDLEERLRGGESFLGLFCEFPGNPLLKCPDLARMRKLADEFDFLIVIDETIGTFANINVLPVADIVVSSLTKIFSGDSNVMGGSAILNPESKHYGTLKKAMNHIYRDNYWPEDAVFMERNSRDFSSRVDRINANAEAVCDTLRPHPVVRDVYYPKHIPSRPNYDIYRLPGGGYGGLLSIVFHHRAQAQVFYDTIETAKGPSLGTNFTLCSPYVLLAHYGELDWAAQFGVDPYLIRVSVGLEETADLQAIFQNALDAAEAASTT